MSEEKIIEGNKLIAEFMKYQHPTEQFSKLIYPFHPSNFKYHTSWDWLMPVVEKMEKDFIVCIWWDCCEISAEKKRMTYPPMIQQRAERKIEATWLAVIEFIKWYNSQPQNQKQ